MHAGACKPREQGVIRENRREGHVQSGLIPPGAVDQKLNPQQRDVIEHQRDNGFVNAPQRLGCNSKYRPNRASTGSLPEIITGNVRLGGIQGQNSATRSPRTPPLKTVLRHRCC